jgi:spore germination cell wall hydrolase CwlJ-like protein
MDLSGGDLDSVTRTILAEAGENATPASMAAVASVIRLDLSGADLDNVTRTIIAEAGQNGTPASMAAVASVIRNRLAAGGYGKTPSEIVHAPNQFEPWNPGSGNDPRRFEAYKQAQALAQGVLRCIHSRLLGLVTSFFAETRQTRHKGRFPL